ncbi:MAG: peptidyl-prolyl cis-trans isomerase [Kiritimatiellales bacterium]|nr:peptidyl-prolyl cis-trans isomerase [Kiritimatiellales bacterium]
MLFIAVAALVSGCEDKKAAPASATQAQEKKGNVMILMKTSKGDIKLELNREAAPKTVANFEKYVESGHYNGTIFHRVIGNFMIQGGGFTPDMQEKSAPDNVENEADNGLSNDIGTIAMARTPDPHSAGAQFFINVGNNGFLNHTAKTQQGWGYCVFGKVVEGLDTVDAIKIVQTGNAGGHQDVPREPVVITEVTVLDD